LVIENNVSQLGYSNQGSTTSRFDSNIDGVTMFTSDGVGQFALGFDQVTNKAFFIDTFNSKGLEYNSSYSSNFTTYSLVDKYYVDNNTILGITSGSGLTGGGSGNFVTIALDTIIPDSRNFTGVVTVSNNFSVTGSTQLNNLTASNTYISSTGSTTLTLYSSGTGSTVFRVQGRSGELFSVTDGLTGSLFSVNDISGLPILEVFSDDTIIMGDFTAPSLYTTTKIITVTGSNLVYSVPTTNYTGAFFDYTVSNGANYRAGNITSVWYGTTASFVETATLDIGSTTGLSFSVGLSGSNAILSASSSTNNWTIKTIVRSI
jgi:hypothetical protein